MSSNPVQPSISGPSTSGSSGLSDSTQVTTGESSSGGGEDVIARHSRRRTPKSVTPIACTACKRAKAKVCETLPFTTPMSSFLFDRTTR